MVSVVSSLTENCHAKQMYIKYAQCYIIAIDKKATSYANIHE